MSNELAEIFDLAQKRKARGLPKLRPITEYPRKLTTQRRLDEGRSPTMPELRATKALLCKEEDEREIAIKEARQCFFKALGILRKLEEDAVVDELLIQNLRTVRTVR